MHSSVIEFDPYQAWLQVGEEDRPLNPYQLLGLKPLEADQARIRAAVERQKLLLERCRAGADEKLWNRVNDELAAAIRTLVDSERKAVLDGTLRRAMNVHVPQPPAEIAERGAAATIECRQCQVPNAANRRFCASCGSPLWEKCPQCNAECSSEERFCGGCGFDIRSGIDQKHREYQTRFEEAQELAKIHRYDSAVSHLRKLAAIDDKRFEQWASRALESIRQIEEQAAELRGQADGAVATARQQIAEHAYDRAADVLMAIPEPLRTTELDDLLRQASATQQELVGLNSSIREAVAQKKLWDLLPKIQRLLILNPDHAQMQKLAGQLRDHFVKLAKAKLAAHKYDEAIQALQQIVSFVRTDDIDTLADKALELECLLQNVRLAATADQQTLALAQKLAKYVPANEEVQKLLPQLEQRVKAAPAEARLAAPHWTQLPPRSHIGRPVEWPGQFTGLGAIPAAVATVLREHPGQFFVALGLALQGLEAAHVPIHLTPEEKVGMLGKLNLSLRRAKPTAAWGLDISDYGLKALKIVRDDKTGALRVDGCEYLVHRKPLTAPDAEIERGDIVEETLKTLCERVSLEGCRVVINVPGQRVLGRFFELPPLPANKVAGAVQYEAKHQLPINLDELCWSYHLVDAGHSKPDEQSRQIILVAAREAHVRERINNCKNAGITVDVVQSDCIALHNGLHLEFFGDKTDAPHSVDAPGRASDRAIAFVDVGTEGTNVAISSAQGTWFRTFGMGGDTFTNALVRQLQLTHEQAELWKREPSRARRLHQFQGVLQPLLVQISSEIERSIASYQKLYPSQKVRQIYGLGGAFQTYGLLRYLRFGK